MPLISEKFSISVFLRPDALIGKHHLDLYWTSGYVCNFVL